MKILIIRNYPSYMAVKNNTYNIQEVGLAKALVRKGHVCDILFWTNKDEEIIEIPVDNVGNVKVYYKKGVSILKNTIFRNCNNLYEKYDILQPCEYNQIQSWILANKYPNKVVIYHGPYYSEFNKRYNLMCKVFDLFCLRRYIKQGTRFLVKSNMACQFLNKKGIARENIKVAGVGIDLQMLSTNSEVNSEDLYLKMKEEKNEIKMLYIGRFEQRRNVDFLVKVFSEIKKIYPRITLYLIGMGEKEYVDNVKKLISTLEISDIVIWQEKMEQKFLSDVYRLADIFLLPTEYEIFGMVLLEAMYYRNVVITTENGGSTTLIRNNENGYIIKDNNLEDWVGIIKDILSKGNIDLIKNNAHDTIRSKYTWDELSEVFIEQYNEKMS